MCMKVLTTAHSSESPICAVICMLLQRSLPQTLNIHVWWETCSALTSFLAANKSLMYGGKVFTRQPPGKYFWFLCQRKISKLLFYIYSLNYSLSCQTHNYFHISTWCVSWARRSCLFNLHHSAGLGVGGVGGIWGHALVFIILTNPGSYARTASVQSCSYDTERRGSPSSLHFSRCYSWTDSFPAAAAWFNSEAVKHFQLPINTFDENKLAARNITDGKHNSRQWNHIRGNAGCRGK